MRDFKILSGSALKVIAIVSMLVDHTAKGILYHSAAMRAPLFIFNDTEISTLYVLICIIGRIAFPIFAFLAVEGYLHTSNIKKYLRDLLIFAFISVIPWNLFHGNGILECNGLNVLFTLFLGVASIYAIDKLKDPVSFVIVCINLAIAHFLRTDYDIYGVLLIILLFWLNNSRKGQFLATIASLFTGMNNAGLLLSGIAMLTYNGKRGFIKWKNAKYIFYAIYPLQYLILWLVKQLI